MLRLNFLLEVKSHACPKPIRAAKRQEIESRIPSHLLYDNGWPVELPPPE
jgi:hypothetical protein